MGIKEPFLSINKQFLFILVALSLGLAGCAKEKSSSKSEKDDGGRSTTPIPRSSTDSDSDSDNATPLKIVNVSTMAKYTQRSLYNPKKIRAEFNMSDQGSGRYGGEIRIMYEDQGDYYEGLFSAGDSENDAKYNIWFMWEGKQVFHGFFEDPWGAIIVVVDEITNFGDGDATNGKAKGSIWFKNFKLNGLAAPQPGKRCWFISLGPYDCRTFIYTSKDEGKMDTTFALYPSNGYTKLGSFEKLDLKTAFGWD